MIRRAPVVETYAVAPAPRSCWVSAYNTKGHGYWGSCAGGTIDTDEGTLGQAEPNIRGYR